MKCCFRLEMRCPLPVHPRISLSRRQHFIETFPGNSRLICPDESLWNAVSDWRCPLPVHPRISLSRRQHFIETFPGNSRLICPDESLWNAVSDWRCPLPVHPRISLSRRQHFIETFPGNSGWSARMSLYEMLFPTGDAPYPSIRRSPLVGDSIL